MSKAKNSRKKTPTREKENPRGSKQEPSCNFLTKIYEIVDVNKTYLNYC